MPLDLGLLLLRLAGAGFMLFAHGLPKLMAWGEKSAGFRDPLGLGSELSFALVVFAEFVCAAFVLVGFRTRLALAPLIVNMAVAGLVAHAPDPFAKKELALLFLTIFTTLALTGPGRYSLDGMKGTSK